MLDWTKYIVLSLLTEKRTISTLYLTRTTALHNRNPLFFSLSVLCTRLWAQGGLERLIYNVNHAVKGKANRKEHAQHQRRTLSCSHIFLSSAPYICPVTTAVPPLLCTKTLGYHHSSLQTCWEDLTLVISLGAGTHCCYFCI